MSKQQSNGDSPMERFEETLGKLVSVTKKELDEALALEKRLAEEAEAAIEHPSDAEPS